MCFNLFAILESVYQKLYQGKGGLEAVWSGGNKELKHRRFRATDGHWKTAVIVSYVLLTTRM